jgi:hypothetical protein
MITGSGSKRNSKNMKQSDDRAQKRVRSVRQVQKVSYREVNESDDDSMSQEITRSKKKEAQGAANTVANQSPNERNSNQADSLEENSGHNKEPSTRKTPTRLCTERTSLKTGHPSDMSKKIPNRSAKKKISYRETSESDIETCAGEKNIDKKTSKRAKVKTHVKLTKTNKNQPSRVQSDLSDGNDYIELSESMKTCNKCWK